MPASKSHEIYHSLIHFIDLFTRAVIIFDKTSQPSRSNFTEIESIPVAFFTLKLLIVLQTKSVFTCSKLKFISSSLGHSNVFFSVLRQMKLRKPTSQQGKKTNKKFKPNKYISFEPTQVMHFIQEK